MRLGLTDSTYQHLFSGPFGFGDRISAYFDSKGFAAPCYLSTQTAILRAQSLEWLINRTAQLGWQVAYGGPRVFDAKAYIAGFRALVEEKGLEVIAALGLDLISGGEATKASIENAYRFLEGYKAFGDVRYCKLCVTPMTHNRFRNDPPLRQQLDLIVENIKPVVRAAEEAGIVFAFENYLDYRASEVVEIIEAVGSPNLKLLFDMGNTTVVIEDPVEAAIVAAPYTVLGHLKDVRILPWTPSALYVAAIFAAPLGSGNVDVVRICEILQERAPNPSDLCLSLENVPVPPNEDHFLFVTEGIKWAKENLAKFLR